MHFNAFIYPLPGYMFALIAMCLCDTEKYGNEQLLPLVVWVIIKDITKVAADKSIFRRRHQKLSWQLFQMNAESYPQSFQSIHYPSPYTLMLHFLQLVVYTANYRTVHVWWASSIEPSSIRCCTAEMGKWLEKTALEVALCWKFPRSTTLKAKQKPWSELHMHEHNRYKSCVSQHPVYNTIL